MNNYENTLAISIKGASHFESGKPMQDYSLAIKGDSFSIAVVCDGHGADKHFRSEVGSRFAAETSRDKLEKFVQLNSDWCTFSKDTDKKLNKLKLSILAEWQEKIEEYTKSRPFTEEELKKASGSFESRRLYDVAQPYGTTILAALVTGDYYLVMMIGDGAIAKINADFTASIVEFPGKHVYDDAPHSAVDSFCSFDAYETTFFAHGQLKENEAVAFALCSDGLSEAYSSDDSLLNRFKVYLNYYAEEGLEKATADITEQLNQISQLSTMKDDISLAFATNNLECFVKSSEANEDPENVTEENVQAVVNGEPIIEECSVEEVVFEVSVDEELDSEKALPEEQLLNKGIDEEETNE